MFALLPYLMHKKIRLVDGFFIRNHLDPEFPIMRYPSISGTSPRYYIPTNEIWMDKQFAKEKHFFVALEKIRYDKKYQKLPYKKMRQIMTKELCKKGPVPNFIQATEKKEKMIIQYVDGSRVRQHLDAEFIFGGHEYVYDYIPHNEIWIDNLQNQKEIPHTLLHEMIEYTHMKAGMNYDAAHDIATAFEKAKRREDGVASYPGDENYTNKFVIPYARKK